MWIVINEENYIQFIEDRPYTLDELAPIPIQHLYIPIEEIISFEEGDKYIDGQVLKPTEYLIKVNDDGIIVEHKKVFEPEEGYINITCEAYNTITVDKEFKYINNEVVEIEVLDKSSKINELKQYIVSNMKFTYNDGYDYSLNEVAMSNFAKTNELVKEFKELLADGTITQEFFNLQLEKFKWFPNGERKDGYTLSFNSLSEWNIFYLTAKLSYTELVEKQLYYTQQIEMASTVEELEAIVFGGAINETTEV